MRFKFSPRILIWLAPFALLAPVWLRGAAMYWGTPATQFVPWWWQAWQTLLGGELPLWNPLLGMGAPLAANYQSALFYPPHWLYFVLAALGGLPLMAWGQALLVAAHLALAGIGLQRLLRALGGNGLGQVIGALAFSLSGYLVARAHFLSINASLAWLPWILLAAYQLAHAPDRRSVLRLAALLAVQWLAGHAQMAWYSLLLTGAWLLFWAWPQAVTRWRAITGMAAASVLALALSAVQLLPTAEYLLQSQRAAQVDTALAMTYSLWPWRLLTLLAPGLFGSPATGDFAGYGNFWEDAIYIGIVPLLFAVLAARKLQPRRLVWLLLGIATISLLLALGDNTPVFPWLFAHVPTFDMFQGPTRFSLWAVLGLSLLAGFGVQYWRPPVGRGLYWSRLAVAGSVAVLLGALVGAALRGTARFDIPHSYIRAMLVLGSSLLLFSIVNLRAWRLAEPARYWLLAGLVSAELLLAGWGLNPGAPLALYSPEPQHAALAAQLDGGRSYLPADDERVLKFEHLLRFDTFYSADPIELRSSLLPNMNLLESLPSANNFDPLLPGRYVQWINALEAADALARANMLVLMNVSVLQHVEPGGAVYFENVPALPRAQLYSCQPPGQLAAELPSQLDTCPLAGEATILHSRTGRVLVNVETQQGGWLLLADTYYPGWHARIDGAPAEIQPAYGVFRAVQVPAGQHEVEFRYQPRSFAIGLGSSVLGWLLWLISWRRTHA
ncbi:MAG: YfhO family protein [Anaerolineales bacterium]|nr:YfhO family protein [Anaerolineales bacterium]